MEYRLPPELERLAEDARLVAEAGASRRPHREDSWVTGYDREFSAELGRRGWLGMTWPIEFGGGGRSPLERFVVTEALIAAGAPIAASWVGDRQIGPTLIAYGDKRQKEQYLSPMAKGTVTWCIGMSEPDAGTDLASLRTRAVRDGTDFVIEGRKIWTSFAADADLCYLIARTGPPGRGNVGLSEFIVEMNAPGVTVHPIVDGTGEAHFCEVELDQVRVPGEAWLGHRTRAGPSSCDNSSMNVQESTAW